MAQRIGQTEFEEKVLQEKLPVLVDFYSDSCMPCKQLAPVLGDIEEEYEGKLQVYKVNVNFEESLTAEYQIMGAPTLILFQEGEVKGKKRGFVKKAELQEWIQSVVAI